MSLRSIFLETTNAPRACFIWMIILSSLFGVMLWDGTNYNLHTDGPMIVLESPAIMRQHFDNDTIITKLKKGDILSVLGIDRSSFGQKWLVKTVQGNVGWVDASDLSGIRQIVTDGADKGDTVSVKAEWLGSHIYRYIYVNSDGIETKKSTKDFMPVMDNAEAIYYDRDVVAGVCTQHKFERKSIGQKFDIVNDAFGYPVLVHVTLDGFEAQYPWKTFDPATGQMEKPNVNFDKDSVATSVIFTCPTKRAAGWLKSLPLASTIIDMPLTTVIVRGSRYIRFVNPMPSTGEKILMYCLVAIVVVAFLLWMFGTQTIPTLVMGWLMVFPPIFAFLNDKWLRALIFVVAVLTCYFWIVVMMTWGMFPFWSLFIIIFAWYAFSLAVNPLCTFPHCRCPECHHLYTIKFDHEVFEYDEIKTGEDVVKGRLLGKRTEKWKTWTKVTTIYNDGSRYVSYKDKQNHERNYRTYEMIDYKVTYRLDHYRLYHKCSCCGFEEETTRVDYTELNRERIGSHTAEFAGEEYTTR